MVRRRIRCVMVCILAAVLLSSAVPVRALQSRTENFSSGYELTGSGAADMVAIALAQVGKTGSQLGYTEEWCANFVSDCAILAGQTDAIPAYAYCSGLYNAILGAGGKVTTGSPQPGDICFINWSGGSSMSHVEIVYKVENGVVHTVGGNSGGGSTLYSRKVHQHSPLSSGYIVTIVRPAYATVNMSYTGRCTRYDTSCTVRVTEDTAVMSLPCYSDVDSDSQIAAQWAAGRDFTAEGIYRNTEGQLWYQTEDGYVPAAATEFVEMTGWEVSVSGVTTPQTMEEGCPFSVEGSIQSSAALSSVSAYVLEGEEKISGDNEAVSALRYNLKGSSLEKALKLSTLEPGTYTYEIRATTRCCYADGNELAYEKQTVTLYSAAFRVIAHTCQYDQFCGYGQTHPHYALYKCSGCGAVKKDTTKPSEMEDCEACWRPPVALPENADLLKLPSAQQVCFLPGIFCSCGH